MSARKLNGFEMVLPLYYSGPYYSSHDSRAYLVVALPGSLAICRISFSYFPECYDTICDLKVGAVLLL